MGESRRAGASPILVEAAGDQLGQGLDRLGRASAPRRVMSMREPGPAASIIRPMIERASTRLAVLG